MSLRGADFARLLIRATKRRKGSEVRHLGCVLGTDDEPEMMPVITGTLAEGTQIGVVRDSVEHPDRRAVFGDTLSPEIREMRPNRPGGAVALSNDAGFYDHPARTRTVHPSICGAPVRHSAAASRQGGRPG